MTFALAGAIVYPGTVLQWLAEKTGRGFVWWHFVIVELVAIGAMILTTWLLMPFYPTLDWWYPLFMVGVLATLRFAMSLIIQLLGYDDD